jgi:hypothetical protein
MQNRKPEAITEIENMKHSKKGFYANGKGSLVQCAACRGVRYFPNGKGHNSPQALGECRSDPWDGDRGQWAGLFHPCRGFVDRETVPDEKAPTVSD